jgi:hypothetical protein
MKRLLILNKLMSGFCLCMVIDAIKSTIAARGCPPSSSVQTYLHV